MVQILYLGFPISSGEFEVDDGNEFEVDDDEDEAAVVALLVVEREGGRLQAVDVLYHEELGRDRILDAPHRL